MEILLQIIYTVLVLGALIFIHEFGHFITAKLSGVKVNEFALGMGPTLLKFQGKETKYAIRLFPIGGFVAMEGEDEESEDERSFSKKSVWKRMIIVVAGAAMNLILGFVITTALVILSTISASTTVLGFEENAVSNTAGLQSGDRIVEINGKEINSYGDIKKAFSLVESDTLDIKVIRKGAETYLEDVKFPSVDKNGKTKPQIDFKISSGLPSTTVGGFIENDLNADS